jgi:cellulose biosynthesis protein BcsQ
VTDRSIEIIQKCVSDLGLSFGTLLAAAATIVTGAATALFTAYKMGKSSMAQAVLLAKLGESHEKQRAIAFSEELATTKQSLVNRDTQIAELNRQVSKCEADLKILGSSRPDDVNVQKHLLLVDELQGRVAKFDQLRGALLGAEDELWKLRGEIPTPAWTDKLRSSRPKIVTVANLKGGVGKTTITANLAAYFSLKGLRVLVIDLDYQGSLTATMLNAAKNTLGTNILADAMLGGEVNGRWLAEQPRDLGAILPKARLVTCGQIFDRFENQTMMRWLIGDIGDDVRYRLANLILSTEVQSAYDLVLIDAPPRSSLGAINAFNASHALLIPTVPDSMSVDAVGRFLRRMNGLRSLAPALGTICVVPSMIQDVRPNDDEIAALSEARLSLSNWSGNAHITEAYIRHFPKLAKYAGRDIGYLKDNRLIRPAFDALGREIEARIGLSL